MTFEHGRADAAGKRVAGEGRAVGAAEILGVAIGPVEHRADRNQAAAERLGKQQHVRDHPFRGAGEQGSGAAEAGLDLVDHELDPVLGAQGRGGGEIARRRLDDAALALDRLDDEGGIVPAAFAQLRVQRRDIAERHISDIEDRRAERLLEGSAPGDRQRAQRLAVEAVAGRQERAPAGGGAGELQRRLGGLGAAVGEGDMGKAGGGDREQAFGKLAGGVVHRGLDKAGLAAVAHVEHRLPDRIGIVAERQRPEAGDRVEDPASVGALEPGAVAADERLIELEPAQQLADVRIDQGLERMSLGALRGGVRLPAAERGEDVDDAAALEQAGKRNFDGELRFQRALQLGQLERAEAETVEGDRRVHLEIRIAESSSGRGGRWRRAAVPRRPRPRAGAAFRSHARLRPAIGRRWRGIRPATHRGPRFAAACRSKSSAGPGRGAGSRRRPRRRGFPPPRPGSRR